MEETSLVILRRLKASPRSVWRALTAPDERSLWLGSDDEHDVVTAEADERDAARFHMVLKSRGGGPSIAIELTRAGDGAELLLRQEVFADRAARDRAERAWKSRIRRLARHVEAR